MKYGNIEDAIVAMIDQTKRGMTSHEYELHLKRLKHYAEIILECEDALGCFDETEHTDPRCIKWSKRLEKYRIKLETEKNMGLKEEA